MKWEERVAAEEERVRRNRIMEGPKKQNCWWLKKGKKKKGGK